MRADVANRLLRAAEQAAFCSYAPYSGRPAGCAVWTASGEVIGGTRVENASYGLLIDPLQNALSTAFAYGREPVVAIALTEPFSQTDLALCAGWIEEAWLIDPDGFALLGQRLGRPAKTGPPMLPEAWRLLDPFLSQGEEAKGLLLARQAAQRARAPESGFRVGCAIQTADGRWVLGCNVEHAHWRHTLCAERNALGTLLSYGGPRARALYISTDRGWPCPPCGACRQVIVELVPPEAEIVFSEDGRLPASALLPSGFRPELLARSP
ncbi:MAG: cytidine deaminase [Bacteroidetes bacterium]|nr:cytidine deaminase [Rhodothermia bacterium]MCS7154629.1 cytidine deaminase [Bacteroidota bacterium]MCX7906346.1 cytidine deaminase [Bacteroidota bacterium]MDW8137422.1 cytidine deaminase [Bacteroidota bacterium]MDW8285624.1 cytidine deaminase [Bacteroidota bacterium]